MGQNIVSILGKDADYLLKHKRTTIPKQDIHLPGRHFIQKVFSISDRSKSVLKLVIRLQIVIWEELG